MQLRRAFLSEITLYDNMVNNAFKIILAISPHTPVFFFFCSVCSICSPLSLLFYLHSSLLSLFSFFYLFSLFSSWQPLRFYQLLSSQLVDKSRCVSSAFSLRSSLRSLPPSLCAHLSLIRCLSQVQNVFKPL